MTDFAKESGHYYWPDGTPAYTVPCADGKGERNTTLRDARKLGLLPSVTTIIRCAAAPGLERYKLRQLGLALLTLPRLPDESEDAFLIRAERDAAEHAKQAAERGTAIHGAFEQCVRRERVPEEFQPHVDAIACVLDANDLPAQIWLPERSFACDLGYGGKVDLHSDSWLLDLKTKDGPLDDQTLWDEQIMQIAAYRYGLGIHQARCGIVFVRRDAPEARFVEADPADLEKGWEMFKSLLAYWRAKTGHRP